MRALRRVAVAGSTVDAQASLSGVVRHSYVDYVWTGNVDLVIRRPINPRIGVFAHGFGELYGVDAAVANRGTQTGGRFEAGVRLAGRGGAVELFAGSSSVSTRTPSTASPSGGRSSASAW